MRILWRQTLPTFWPISTGSSDRVHYGGTQSASFANNTTLMPGVVAPGRTFLCTQMRQRIWQHGYIRRVVVWITGTNAGTPLRFKVFRPTVNGYEYVGQSEAVAAGSTGTITHNLVTPIACQPGDILGFWLQESATLSVSARSASGQNCHYIAGDITSTLTDSQLTTVSDFVPNIEALGIPPFLVATGDSIAEGQHTVTPWEGPLDDGDGPSGDIEAEVWYWLRNYLGGATQLEYQNMALGGQTYAWVVSNALSLIEDALPSAVVIHCGVNDVATGRTWSAVEANLDTIRTTLPAINVDLFIDEILPWTAGNNTQAATIRTWNSNLATWCAANNAILVQCHDEMGQTRSSTGQLDNLNDDYDYDGIHLTRAGVMRLAQLIGEAMNEYYA